jgi:transcriptional regulator with XRE-family HTH domain
MNFGLKMMEILRGMGVSYLEFCRRCGASHSSLNRWAGGQSPRIDYFVSACETLATMTGRGVDDVILDMLESVPEYRSAKRRERK